MPRKAEITREAMVQAAVALVREEGVERLNVRALASRLGCSTQPILYQFGSMQELRRETYAAADALHDARITEDVEAAESPLMQLGLNYVRFAYEEPRLFRFLFQTDAFGGQDLASLVAAPDVSELVALVAQTAGMDESQARRVFLVIFVAAHGYASLLANNALTYDEAQVAGVLDAAYAGALQREGW